MPCDNTNNNTNKDACADVDTRAIAEPAMSLTERLFHASLFEIGAVIVTVLVFWGFGGGDSMAHTGVLSVAISVIAVLWNLVFNYAFDKVHTSERSKRGLGVRLCHTALFEGGLFVITVPLIAWVMNVSLWQALVMDVSIVLVIGVYTLAFNWLYDCLRYRIICHRQRWTKGHH